uniref:Odorant-binding protein n=1 Tax=Euschistus heros TaxID=437493 RepID=D9J2G2_EUSHE|nr:odorant-binding protein [Euschistus heros]
MKGITTALAFTLLLATIEAEENVKAKIMKVFNTCKEKHPVTDDELAAFRKADIGFGYSHDAKCMLACMLEEGKMLKDGKYLKENALIMADVFHIDDFDEAAKARKVIENCSVEVSEVGPDQCEFAYKMAVCGANESKKLGMKEHDFFE